jgi:hypothetical protein
LCIVALVSVPAVVFGSTPPANDNFADATTISALPYTNSEDTSSATVEANEPFGSCVYHYPPYSSVWYRYVPSQSGRLRMSASYSGFLVAWEGTAIDSLNELACVGSGNGLFDVQAGHTYYIQAFNINGYSGTLSLSVDVVSGSTLPSLSVNDVSVNESAGNATFTVSLSAASGQSVTVNYATSDGAATAPAD